MMYYVETEAETKERVHIEFPMRLETITIGSSFNEWLWPSAS